ncbi:hypothetical protein DAI22_04g044800 [Oryza sativa Japonica Group]|nr:hypothetical protein DAI22_04g044800 [Oryza sativa Japonica Group]
MNDGQGYFAGKPAKPNDKEQQAGDEETQAVDAQTPGAVHASRALEEQQARRSLAVFCMHITQLNHSSKLHGGSCHGSASLCCKL